MTVHEPETRTGTPHAESAEAALIRDADRDARRRAINRASIGRVLVALAIFAPALVVLGVYLLLQDRLYGYHVPGPRWPWIVADLAVLGIGIQLMRGEDL